MQPPLLNGSATAMDRYGPEKHVQPQPQQGGARDSGTWLYALIFGVLLSVWEGRPISFAIGAGFGYLLARVIQLTRRVTELEQQQRLHAATAPLQRTPMASPPSAAQAAGVTPPASPPANVPMAAAPAAHPPRATVAASGAEAAPTPSEPAASSRVPTWESMPPPPSPQPSLLELGLAKALRWFKGGNPAARAGIVILFFGLAFLAKYAAERTVVPMELRFVLIAATALGLLVIGWRLRRSRRIYAHILQGGGVAGLYLTVFAATRLYALLPVGLALGLMVLIAVAAALLAVAQHSLPLAVIGTAGGFMAPLLVSTGSGNHIALFSYYAVLNLGIFVVAWFRAWRVLNLVGFVFTFGIVGLFRVSSYAPDQRLSTAGFLLLFFLLYVGISILFSLRQKPQLRGYVSGSLVFGLPVAAFGLYGSLVDGIPYALAWSALAMGAFYLLLAWALRRSGVQGLQLLSEAFAAMGLIFASLAVPLAFDVRTTSAMWAVEGAGLLWLGLRQQRPLVRAFGVLLQLLAGGSYLIGGAPADGLPVLNAAYLGVVMLALAGGLSSWWLHRAAAVLKPWESSASPAFMLWAAAWWISGSLHEIDRGWPAQDAGLMLAFLALNIAVFSRLSRRVEWPQLGQFAFVLVLPAVVIGLLQGLAHSHPAAAAAVLGWPLLLAVWYRLLWQLDRGPGSPLLAAVPIAHAATLWLVVLLAAWEMSWQLGRVVAGVWPDLPWGLLPALALWSIGATSPRPAWPLASHAQTYRRLAAPVLAAFALLWVLAINLGSDGNATPLIYLPLLNPLDIGIALVLLAVAWYGRSMGVVERLRGGDASLRPLVFAAAALLFFWLNAMLARALHHLLGIPLHIDALADYTLAQAAFSVFWGLIGFTAMIVASRRHWRSCWIAGAVLMVIVVGKLFLVDTANSGTLARVFSFITVGVLLLVVGYVSPLPPPKRAGEET